MKNKQLKQFSSRLIHDFVRIGFCALLLFGAWQTVCAATLTVTKLKDTEDGACNADCSLREAIAAAASGDTVVFNATVFAGTQTVDLTLGELFINTNLSIEGTSAARLIVRRAPAGTQNFRIFNINFGRTFNLSKMTVGNGASVTANGKVGSGGGIAINAGGRLNLSNVIVRGNSASDNGGGIHNNFGTLNVADSSILENTAGSFGGGISSAQAAGQTIVSNTTIKDNAAGGGGGGINLSGGASFSLTNSSVDSNRVTFGSNGGAGVGINSVTGVIGNSTISRNQCQSQNCNGGGINVNANANVTVYNSTVANNSAPLGSGIMSFQTLLLVNTTIAFNTASSVNGTALDRLSGSLKLRNSLIADNTGSATPDVRGAMTSLGNNLIGNAAGGSGFSQTSNDILNPAGGARLSALANNGGATETAALLSASRAINNGNNCVRNQSCQTDNLPAAMTTDQRLLNRGTAIDIGAFEVIRAPTAATISLSGRVLTAANRGLRNARVTLTDQTGATRIVLTGAFGYYNFDDVAAGETYIIAIESKRYQFQPQVVHATEAMSDLDFTADQ